MLSAKICTKWIIGRTKLIFEYISYLALVEYHTKWIRIKWGPGALRALKTLFLCKEFCKKSWKKNNTWNIRCLVDELFIPVTQQPSDLAYHIEDCRILGQSLLSKDWNHCTGYFLIPLIRTHCTIYGPPGCKFDPHICQMCLKLKCNWIRKMMIEMRYIYRSLTENTLEIFDLSWQKWSSSKLYMLPYFLIQFLS